MKRLSEVMDIIRDALLADDPHGFLSSPEGRKELIDGLHGAIFGK